MSLQGKYASVNGLELYYEVHGQPRRGTPPLMLLHGGGDTIETSFGPILPKLAQNRQIIAYERQGYGHTADIAERAFSFEQFADDAAALTLATAVPSRSRLRSVIGERCESSCSHRHF